MGSVLLFLGIGLISIVLIVLMVVIVVILYKRKGSKNGNNGNSSGTSSGTSTGTSTGTSSYEDDDVGTSSYEDDDVGTSPYEDDDVGTSSGTSGDSTTIDDGSVADSTSYNDDVEEYTIDDSYTLKFTENASLNTLTKPVMNLVSKYYKKLVKIDYSNISDVMINTSRSFSLKYLYLNCSGLKSIDFGTKFDTSNATSMYGMFRSCTSLITLDVTHFDTSNVTTMDGMFYYCSSLKKLNVSSFDTSNVESMESMFYGCKSLVTLEGLTSFDTSNVTNMFEMFDYCSALVSLDLSSFNTSNITTMKDMFNNCSSLKSIDFGTNFDTSKVTNMKWMFYGCESLTSLNLSSFDTSKVTSMPGMFQGCSSLLMVDISGFTIPSANKSMSDGMFTNVNSNEWHLYANGNTITTLTNNDVLTTTTSSSSVDLSSIVDDTIYDCVMASNEITSLHVDTGVSITENGGKYEVTFNERAQLATLTTPIKLLLPTIYTDITAIDYSYINSDYTRARSTIDVSELFAECTSLTSVDFGSYFPSTRITSAKHMFYNCTSLKSLDLSEFNTSAIVYMYEMFAKCSSLESITFGTNFDTSNVTSMYRMFADCSSLESIDLSGFDTSAVMTMYGMFDGCSSLSSIEFGSNFKASNVSDMKTMFRNCNSLTSLDLSSFNTQSLVYTDYMFYGCSSLESIDFGLNFYTSNVMSMESMFYKCSSLKSYDTSSSSSSDYETYGPSLDLTSFDTSNVRNMAYMFYGCASFTSLNLSSFYTPYVSSTDYMFQYCTSLVSLDISQFCLDSISTHEGMFLNVGTYNDDAIWYLTAKGKFLNDAIDDEILRGNCSYADDDAFTVKCYDYVIDDYLYVTETYACGKTGHQLLHFDLTNGYTFVVDMNDANDSSIPTDIVSITKSDITCNGYGSLKFEVYAATTGNNEANLHFYTDDASKGSCTIEYNSSEHALSCTYYPMTSEYWLENNVLTFTKYASSDTLYTRIKDLITDDYGTITKIDYRCIISGVMTETRDEYKLTQLYRDCSSLKSIDFGTNFDTSKVTSMYTMFSDCSSLESIDLSEFNTSNVTNMHGMFMRCNALTKLDLSGFDTSNVTDMGYMFAQCTSLESVDIRKFEISSDTYTALMFLSVGGEYTTSDNNPFTVIAKGSFLNTIRTNDWNDISGLSSDGYDDSALYKLTLLFGAGGYTRVTKTETLSS